MSRKVNRSKTNKINQINKIRNRNIAIVLIIAICLFVIYRINFLTKSESTIPMTSVKFIEYGSENELIQDLELYEDENGESYIILPDKVNGIFAQKYHVSKENLEKEENKNVNEIANTIENNVIENPVTNSVNNEVINVVNEVKETENIVTNTIAENKEITNTVNEITNQSTNEIATESLFDKVIQTNSENTEQENIESEEKEQDNNKEKSNENLEEKKESEVDTNTIDNTINTNTIKNENTIENNKSTNTTSVDNTVANTVEQNTIVKDENQQVENKTEEPYLIEKTENKENNTQEKIEDFSGSFPGERIYLTEEQLKNDSLSIEVEYQTIEINNLKLYNQELITSDEEAEIKVVGYMPFNYYIEAIKEDVQKYEELKSDVDSIADSKVIHAYDINITNGTEYYQPKDYFQTVNVSIMSKKQEEAKFTESLVQVLHIKDEAEQIIFEKIALTSKTEDTVEMITNEFSVYILTATSSSVGEEQVYIYDYEKDRYYLKGKKYTDSLNGEATTNANGDVVTKEFADEELAQVIINYYSYDYVYQDQDKDEAGVLYYYVPKINSRTSTETNINGTPKFLTSYTLTFESNDRIDTTTDGLSWDLSFASNGNLDINTTQNYTFMSNGVNVNQIDRISEISHENGIITVSNDSFNGWTESVTDTGKYAYKITIFFVFNATTDLTTTFDMVVHKELAIGFTSNTERQTLYTYNKCLYAPNGSVTVELIDNPYMDRPAGYGFNGWKTNEGTKYTINTNQYTFEQTVTANLEDLKDAEGNYVINLYADWATANIVFLDGASGNDNNSGRTVDLPVRSWATAVNRLNDSFRTTNTASNRELNIIVLKGGTINTNATNMNLGNVGEAYTLTSLYDGILYSNNAAITVNSQETLSYDLQLDFLKINSGTNYQNNDGTGNINYYLCGNAKNLRIGRGIITAVDGRTTFPQIQGGPSSTSGVSQTYKVVIEEGAYNNIQIGRASASGSYTTTGILVLGSDIDRINNVNNKLKSYYRVSSRTSTQTITGSKNGIRYLGNEIKTANGINYFMIIKSGSFGLDYFNNYTGTDRAYSGIYLGGHGSSGNDKSDRYMVVEGGAIANIIGGLQTTNDTVAKTCIYVKNGSVQNIVGGAGVTQTYGDRVIQVTGGEITYSVSGGSNGYAANTDSATSGNNGRLVGDTYVYIGGTAKIGTVDTSNELYDVQAGCVLGAGNGNARDFSGTVNTSHVVVADQAQISNRVYGAGNFGRVVGDVGSGSQTGGNTSLTTGTAYMIRTGTTSGNVLANTSGTTISAPTFSGDMNVPNSYQWILESASGGYYLKNKETGNYLCLTVERVGRVTERELYLSASTPPTAITLTQNNNGAYSFRVRNGYYTAYMRYNNGSWEASGTQTYYYFIEPQVPDIGDDTEEIEDSLTIIDILGGTVKKEVFGGGNQKGVDGTITINMKDGIVEGSIYGGPNDEGTIEGNARLNITGGKIGSPLRNATQDDEGTEGSEDGDALFGGGKGSATEISGKVELKIQDIDKNIEITGNIYGGSKLGNVVKATNISVEDKYSDDYTITHNYNSNENVTDGITTAKIFGGGKGNAANAATSNTVKVTIDGGNYANTQAFGGCNINGIIYGEIAVNVGQTTVTNIKEVYGGGNNATITNNTVSDIVNLYHNTTVENAFNGGNNEGIDSSSTTRAINVIGATVTDSVYGGSNTLGTLTETHVICSDGARISNVYGGGKGEDTEINGDTDVQINNSTIYITANGTGNVYGGGNAGTVNGNTVIKVTETTVENSIYGGGKAAAVNGTTSVEMISSTANEIYGGGEEGAVTDTSEQATYVKINDCTLNNVYGGGKGEPAIVSGSTKVEIFKLGADITNQIDDATLVDKNPTNIINNSVYGGGNAGAVQGNTSVDISNTSVIESVFGGGNQAIVNGNTKIDFYAATTKAIYGGGNAGNVGESTTASINHSEISDIVYGGGNQGDVGGNTNVTVSNSNITNSVYGGGNAGDVTGNTNVALDTSEINVGVSNSETKVVFGGGNQGAVGGTTAVSILDANITDSVYGGGNEGEVGGNTSVTISNIYFDLASTTNPKVANNVFGGGKAARVNGTEVKLNSNARTQNVYGGGDQGDVTESTNVLISDSIIENNIYGGGNGAENPNNDGTLPGSVGKNTTVRISNTTAKYVFGGGKGITAAVGGDVNLTLNEGTQIENDVYGGGDNGYVSGSTYVAFSSPQIGKDAYAAGNGEKAIVHGSSHVYTEGKTTIEGNLYGGGNAAETGENGQKNALATVDIAGLVINGNVYGGANSSQINGSTVINVGNEAINTYYDENKGYEQGIIHIKGTIYGGGQSMVVDSEVWVDTAISVTDQIYINVYGDGYDTSDDNTMNIDGSIFGSGNASNAAQDGFLEIRNYGTDTNRKKLSSIQRCSISRIDNSVLMISGVKDSTSNFKETPFTFNKIAELKLQNNSILYLRSGANRVSKFESLNADGITYAEVTINDDYTVNATSDNRIYMANGTNLNICYGDPQKLEVSPVKGMTFFGMYKSAPEGHNDPDNIYKGIYDQEYVTGGALTVDDWNSRDYLRTYVYGEHTKVPVDQDTDKDGFYTNFESLDEGYKYDNIGVDYFSAKTFTAYIDPTPRGEYAYYYWFAGPDQHTYTYDIELTASKFSTLGSYELAFSDMNFPDATLTMSGIDYSGMENDVQLIDKNLIENINMNVGENPNKIVALSMKSGNSGWSKGGTTDFYKSNIVTGETEYKFENAETTPSLSFFLYHSNNITENNNLGTYKILMDLRYWKDKLNSGTARVIINVTMYTRVYEGVGYNTAITPGMQYDLFTSTLTNVTTKSSFSTYFEMGEANFFDSLDKVIEDTGLTVPENYYEQSYRVISTGKYVFPENTTITMIDRYDKNNPAYYYYTVTAADEADGKKEFLLDEFLVMGSTNKNYSEAEMREKYYLSDKNYQYENFIFIVNFEGANFDEYDEDAKITPDENYFEMFLKLDVTQNGENATIDLAKIINDQLGTTGYGIYKTDSTIGIEASLSKNKIYLGNDVTLKVRTTYNASNKTATVFDTRYFDKKLGVKLTFYQVEGGVETVIGGGTILGTEFRLNNVSYYPRTDGTTRIKIAELVSNSSSDISIVTDKSTLETGDYKIKVESFGSADGIYFGVEASAEDTVEMTIVNDTYGLESHLDSEKQAIIDSETGLTLNDEGYISEVEDDNKLNLSLDYQSGVNDPYITVALYRRNYDSKDVENPNVYDNTYTLVDLKDYVTNEFILPTEIVSPYDENDAEECEFIESLKHFEKEYEAINTETITNNVIDTYNSYTFDGLDYELKQNLKTGTYKLVYTLYDINPIIAERQIKDEEGTVIDVIEYDVNEYQKIGDTFSYIIIK